MKLLISRNFKSQTKNLFMKSLFTLLFSFICFAAFSQVRYLDNQFEVEVVQDVTYGMNIGVITGAPVPEELKMDVYMPKDDTETNRPLILVSHTGSFLPPVINGQATGSRLDGSVTYMAAQLAAKGYVVAAYSYRLGWNPIGDENVRRNTLLNAAYRGIQDTRTCVRFFRKEAAENSNPYGIDPAKVGVVGIGTGGYMALGAGSLYDFEDVLLDKFIDTNTALPYIDSLIVGNLFADAQAAICIPNHAGYSSEIDFSFNIGGAMGDQAWIDGDPREAAFSGVHATNDIFAPYAEGPVIVPTTNEFVVNVAGTRAAIQYANERGNNDVFNALQTDDDPLSDLIDVQKDSDLTLYTGQMLKQGTDNFYSFATPFPQGSPWDFWDYNILSLVVAGTNAALGTDYNADTIHMNGLATNPDMSQMKSETYLDSCFMLMLPRACTVFGLGCFDSNTKDVLNANDVNLTIAPNPAAEAITFAIQNESNIESLRLYDINGMLISVNNVDAQEFTLLRNGLSSGMYLVQLVFEEGLLTQRIVFE
jgi:hypothetical protein